MEAFSVPERIRFWCFDIDNTLYTHADYARHQYDVLYSALARWLEREEDPLREEIENWRSTQARESKPSLGTAFTHWGADIAMSVAWRSRFIRPEDYLTPDHRLNESIGYLISAGTRAIAVTNNPSDIGWRTLKCLGIEELIEDVVGLDHSMASKPDSDHFDRALDSIGEPARFGVSVGDRFAIDIKPALERGMGGILVDGVEDVYRLPDSMAARLAAP
jgi:FMN phosphatase YigB (HAD superfamily)